MDDYKKTVLSVHIKTAADMKSQLVVCSYKPKPEPNLNKERGLEMKSHSE